jgi:hypothetical protein
LNFLTKRCRNVCFQADTQETIPQKWPAQFIAVCSGGKSVVHITKITVKFPQPIDFHDEMRLSSENEII